MVLAVRMYEYVVVHAFISCSQWYMFSSQLGQIEDVPC